LTNQVKGLTYSIPGALRKFYPLAQEIVEQALEEASKNEAVDPDVKKRLREILELIYKNL